MIYKVLNYGGFYLGWLACVKGAAAGYPWLGPAATALLVAAHLYVVPDARREARGLAAVGALGLVVDTLVPALGLYRFAGTWDAAPWLAPAWIVALWVLLAATFDSSLSWCARRPLLSAALGAVAGPFSFLAGEALGAATLLPASRALGLAGVGAVWAAGFPAACFAFRRAAR